MATSLSQKDVNFLRLSGLLLKIAQRAVRQRFNDEFHPGQLKQFLNKNRREIDNLTYKKRVITLTQYDLLFPKGSSGVSSDMFDVSLMVCLLRHFTDLDIQDSLPLETILTTAADISRIRFYRNYIVHSDSDKVTENKFLEIWCCVSEAILRLVPDLKSAVYAMMSATITNDSDIIDVIRLEKQMENTNQHLNTVSQKLDTLEIEHNNKREIHNRTLKEWRDKDEKYISTSATTFILQSLTKKRGVIITGSPGCGKSIAAHHVALTFEKEGYEVVPCDDPLEILKHFTTEKIQVFVIDDICGKFSLNQHKADSWEQEHGKLSMLFELCNQNIDNEDSSRKSETKFIITCRDNIFSHKAFPKLTCLSLVQCSFSTKYKISEDEMRKVALSYLPTNTVNDIDNICLYDFFPLLCALYCQKAKQDPNFFIHPIEIIEQEIKEMKIKSETSFLCLSLLVIKNNKYCKDELGSRGMVQLVKAICKNSEIESVVSTVSIQKCFERLEGIYISESENFYTAIHDKMFDIISAAIAPSIMNCLIKFVDIAFITHRIQLSSCGQSSLPFAVYIPPEMERSYLRRQYKEAIKGKNWEVFGSMQSENKTYRKLLLSFLKEQDKCQEITYISDKDGATPLFVSSFIGYIDFVEFFIVRCPSHKDEKDKDGRSCFYVACENGNMDTVKLLMKFHHDINTENAEKTTALSATCLNGHADVAQLLLENNADINKTNKINQSAMHFACTNGNVELVQRLLSTGNNVDITIRDTFGKTALHVVCEKGHRDIVKTLMECGIDLNQKDKIGQTPLYLACKNGCYDTVRYIIDFNYSNKTKTTIADELNNSYKTKDEWSVLHAACFNGHTKVVKLLIDAGLNVNDTENNGSTPLILACENGHNETVKSLLNLNGKKLESRVNTTTRNKYGWSCLHSACFNGHTEVVKLLIDIGLRVNDTIYIGYTPLYLACQNGHYDTVKLLLDLNGQILNSCVDTATRYKDGWTVLHTACAKGHTNIVKLLIDMAVRNGHQETVKFLLNLKSQTLNSCVDKTIKQEDAWSALHKACNNGHIEIVKLLIDNGMNVNDTTHNGQTPLFLACQKGHCDIVKLLLGFIGQTLNSCVDKTIKTKYGLSVLHAACSEGHTEVVKLLIDNGMNVNDRTSKGDTSLHLACQNGHNETVKYLLDLNGKSLNSVVDTTMKNKNGKTAVDAAYLNGHKEVVKLLTDIDINHSCMIL
ncbi:Hypothetical predicted protein [Mytilus galloprovincialis]|uniref:DZIP3-like HEPN domain-containing protein n=1 Tax=Mytilus galloprovincialis TaxID=29158 RepID=A0A8B6F6N2_MYTGA|nr:Hypothetical predicted protein [Mytilus galloprovincialis]